MSNIKDLKSIDLSSFTIIGTGIGIIFAVIFSIAVAIGIGVITPGSIGVSIYIIPTIIAGSFIMGIYECFSNGLFYNLLSTKLRNINVELNGNELVKVSTTETATIVATISLIQSILIYAVSLFILPLIINATIQTLVFSGQQAIAYTLYQILVILNQPMTIIMFIFGSFVVTFIFVLIGAYIYNLLGSKGRGVTLELSEENGMTAIDSIDMLSFAIAIAIINGALNLIFAIVMIISGGNPMSLILNVVSGIISGFVSSALIAIFYNFLAPKLVKLKIELIDQ